MNQWKPNKRQWYALGLVVLLCMAFLVVSTGTSFARYRTEKQKDITFEVREPEQLCLGTFQTITQEDGTVVAENVFTPTEILAWETTGDTSQLTFTVANGVSEEAFSKKDQKIRVSLIGTLGLWTGTETVELYLNVPSETEPEKTEKLQTMVTPITEGTVLYHTYGPGWIYSFQNSDEEELSWILPGGAFSYVTLTVTMEGATPQEAASLQPHIVAEVISG